MGSNVQAFVKRQTEDRRWLEKWKENSGGGKPALRYTPKWSARRGVVGIVLRCVCGGARGPPSVPRTLEPMNGGGGGSGKGGSSPPRPRKPFCLLPCKSWSTASENGASLGSVCTSFLFMCRHFGLWLWGCGGVGGRETWANTQPGGRLAVRSPAPTPADHHMPHWKTPQKLCSIALE